MTDSGNQSCDYATFQAHLMDACRQAVAQLREKHAGEIFYTFVLIRSPLCDWVELNGCTEEGIARVIARYRSEGDTEPDLDLRLRWSPGDYPVERQVSEDMAAHPVTDSADEIASVVEELLNAQGWEGEGFKRAVDEFADACLLALQALDAEGLFGQGEERAKVLVNLVLPDEEGASRLATAKRLNPAESWQAYRP